MVAAVISLVFNNVDSIFMPYERLTAFLLLLSLLSPLISSKVLENFRKTTFSFINKMIMLLVVASFLGWLTGYYTGVEGRRDFTGLFSHSMILGPMAAICLLNAAYLFYKENNKTLKTFYIFIIIISFLTGILAGSRIALVGALGGILFFHFKYHQYKLTKFLRVALVFLSVLILTYPFWEKYTEFMKVKTNYARTTTELFSSRTDLWFVRIMEFKNSPITGIGYASVDESLDRKFGRIDYYYIEPGSSYLTILSMTGILGFIPFLLLLYSNFLFIYKSNSERLYLAYIGSLFVFLFIHMIAEGYVFSAGSGLFFYFWLSIGNIDILNKRKRLRNAFLPLEAK
ncbi:MAG: O-antigen ligase family protein [Ignavibacterium sp.]|nr:O-antigen ligase family protein [Ignavibacterium sp.]